MESEMGGREGEEAGLDVGGYKVRGVKWGMAGIFFLC